MTEPFEADADIADMAVVVFGDRRVPRPLSGLAVVRVDDTGARTPSMARSGHSGGWSCWAATPSWPPC